MGRLPLRRIALAVGGFVAASMSMPATHAGLFSNSTAGYQYFDSFVISAVQPGYRGPVDGNVANQLSTAEPSANTSASYSATVPEGSFANQASATATYKTLAISASNQGNPSISWPGAQAHAAWTDTITLTGGTGSAWWVCSVHLTGTMSATGSLGLSQFGLAVFKNNGLLNGFGDGTDAYQKFLVLNGGTNGIRNPVIKFAWASQEVYYGAKVVAGSAEPGDNVGLFAIDKTVSFVVPFTYGQQFSLGFRTGGQVGEAVRSGDTSFNTAAFDIGVAWNGKGYVLPSLSENTQFTGFSIASGSGEDWAVAAVPEPATWIMGVGGIVGAAWGAFLRRKGRARSRSLPEPRPC